MNARLCSACLAAGAALLCAVVPALSAAAFVNFETAPVHPVAFHAQAQTVAVCNLPDYRVELFDVSGSVPVPLGGVPVGVDPVSVRFRTANELWVVNHVSSTVSIVDVAARRVVATLETKPGPADLVFGGSPQRAFVSCAKADIVLVIDPESRQVLTSIPIAGDRPKAMAVSTDGSRVYVAIFESGNASTILSPRFTFFDTSPEPSVVSYPGGPYGGQDPPPNDGAAFNPPLSPDLDTDFQPTGSLIVKKNAAGRWMDDNHGDWTEFVSGTNAAMSGRPEGWDMPDRDLAIIDTATYGVTYATGLMNICMDVAVNPVSGKIAVIGTDMLNERRFEPNLRSVFLRVNLALVDPVTLAANIVDLNPHLDYAIRSIPQAQRDLSIGDPRGMVWNAAGTRAYISGMGSRNLVVVDADGHRVVPATVEMGDGPTGLALDESRARLFVWNRFSATLAVLDTSTLQVSSSVALFDPTPAAIKAGRKHLYDTRRNSGLGHAACASCHVDVRFDRLAWDLGNPAGEMVRTEDGRTFHPMKGPMVTQTLQDMLQPLHWRADRNTLDDFNSTFVDLLGADTLLSTDAMQEFKDFLGTIYFPPNHFRNFDNALPTNLPLPGHFGIAPDRSLNQTPLPNGNAQAGRKIFEERRFDVGDIGHVERTARCDLCHNGDTGFGVEGGPKLTLARNLGLPFKGAQLRNLPEKIGMDRVSTSSRAGFGFMHDGRADTLTRVVADGLGLGRGEVSNEESNQEIADMVAFLLSFTGGGLFTGSDGDHDGLDTAAAVGRQVTLSNTAPHLLLQSMLALSDSWFNGVNLVAHGQGRGWYYNPDSGRFQSDRNAEDVSVGAFLALAAPGNELTFTLTPVGTGARFAVDRDNDGFLDQTERDYGFDPLDPQSRPGNTPPRFAFVPPLFSALPQLQTHPGLLASTTDIVATDADEPAQTLIYSLTDDAPPGATIDPATGFFSWTPPLDEPGGLRRIAVRVRDNGSPPLDHVQRMDVTIVPLRAYWIYRGSIDGEVLMRWHSVDGAHYGVQYKDRLDDPDWNLLGGGITLFAGSAQKEDYTAADVQQRFYRIILLE